VGSIAPEVRRVAAAVLRDGSGTVADRREPGQRPADTERAVAGLAVVVEAKTGREVTAAMWHPERQIILRRAIGVYVEATLGPARVGLGIDDSASWDANGWGCARLSRLVSSTGLGLLTDF